jgi:hypothetical protein
LVHYLIQIDIANTLSALSFLQDKNQTQNIGQIVTPELSRYPYEGHILHKLEFSHSLG